MAHMQHTRQLHLCTGEMELPDITRHAGMICKAADGSLSALRCACSACFLCSSPPLQRLGECPLQCIAPGARKMCTL